MGARHFRDLECWQVASELKREVYALIATDTVKRDRDFCDDIRRAVRSAPANIAEGFRRYGHRDFARFLSIALASLSETENHLQDAFDSQYISSEEHARLTAIAVRAQKLTQRLHTYCMNTPDRRTPRADGPRNA